jgi:lipopolysaccharide biosynthesis regulator YciM
MKTVSRSSKFALAAAGALLAAALLAAGALAVTSPDQTRESYVTQVEPICKQNTKANERTLAGVRKKIQKGQLKVAAGQFTKASRAFGQAVKQIETVLQPPADTAKLQKWFGYLEEETDLLAEIGKALKAENKTKAQKLSVQLTHNGNVANNAVLGFDFDYCLIDSSRFS